MVTSFRFRRFLTGLAVCLLPALLLAYGKESHSGLLFTAATRTWVETPESATARGVKRALLVSPADEPARGHYSNSSMARVELFSLAANGLLECPGGAEAPGERILLALEGAIDVTAGGATLHADRGEGIYVPAGMACRIAAAGGAPAVVVSGDWRGEPQGTAATTQAFVVAERLRPLQPTHGEGYLTVGPNARQQGNALSIHGYGASHIRAGNSLLLYPQDITTGRPFTANTRVARMGLSQYQPEGGTRWHFHPDREQCFVILAGRGLVEIGANTVEVQAGDVIFAPRHVGHAYRTTGDAPLKFFELEWGR
jgi:mannose-6-phosphate isomerase-like protein (cupin superfamily)